MYLGDDTFVETLQAMVAKDQDLPEVPSVQKRRMSKPIAKYIESASSRNDGIYQAYRSGAYTMKAISDNLGLHYSTVSKIIKDFENSIFKTCPYFYKTSTVTGQSIVVDGGIHFH